MIKTTPLIILMSMALAACSNNPQRDHAQASAESVQPATEAISSEALAAADANSAAVPAEPVEKVVCERITRTGSHRVQRVCYTVVEGEDLARDNRDAAEALGRRGVCGTGCSAGLKKSLEGVPN